MATSKTEVWIAESILPSVRKATTVAYCFDTRTGAWHKEDNFFAETVARWNGPPDLNELMIGTSDSNGLVRQYSTGASDQGNAIVGSFETGRLDLGDAEIFKQLREVQVEMESTTTLPAPSDVAYETEDGSFVSIAQYAQKGVVRRYKVPNTPEGRYYRFRVVIATATLVRVRLSGLIARILDSGPREA